MTEEKVRFEETEFKRVWEGYELSFFAITKHFGKDTHSVVSKAKMMGLMAAPERILTRFLRKFQLNVTPEERQALSRFLVDRNYRGEGYSTVPLYIFYYVKLCTPYEISDEEFERYLNQIGIESYPTGVKRRVKKLISTHFNIYSPKAMVRGKILGLFEKFCQANSDTLFPPIQRNIQRVIESPKNEWQGKPRVELGRLLYFFLKLVGMPLPQEELADKVKTSTFSIRKGKEGTLKKVRKVMGDAWVDSRLAHLQQESTREKATALEMEILQIISRLGEVIPTVIAEEVGINSMTLHDYLKILEGAGSVQVRKLGVYRPYRLGENLPADTLEKLPRPEEQFKDLPPAKIDTITLKTLPPQQRVVLLTLLQISRVTRRDGVYLGRCKSAYEDICREFGVVPYPSDRWVEFVKRLIESLSTLQLIKVQKRNRRPYIQTGRLSQIPRFEEILVNELQSADGFGRSQD